MLKIASCKYVGKDGKCKWEKDIRNVKL